MKEKRFLPDGLAAYGTLALLLLLGIAAFVFRQEFSVPEKRYLAELPRNLSLTDWTLDEDTEAFLSDQIPFRQQLVNLDAESQALTGRAVQLGAWPVGDAIVEKPVTADAETLLKRVDALRGVAGEIPCLFLTPPTAGMLRMGEMSPARQAVYREESRLYELLTAREGFVPLEESFRGSGEEVFFRTDHHWNLHGAYLAYRAYCGAAGLQPKAPEDFTHTEYSPFYGTTASRSGLPAAAADTLVCAEPKTQVTLAFDGEEYGHLIFPEEAGTYDGYAVYLKGNHGILTVENPEAEGTLFICKDSFANSLIPFLAAHYGRIVATDARYMTGTLNEALEAYGPADAVLFLYSLDSLANDTSIPRRIRRK